MRDPFKQETTPSTRKSFLLWGAALLSAFGAMRIIKCSQKKKEDGKPVTVKMLGQDGKLVEVDVSDLACGNRKKVSDKELQNWVARK
jgi:hypothetical protein